MRVLEKPTVEELYWRMRRCLAAPPSRAGISIKSEPALAKMLGLKRPTVRKVIDRFVEEGVLVRRNGSGTYVRKVAAGDDVNEAVDPLFAAESIFNVIEERQQRREPLNADKRIRIGTVWDLNSQPSGVYKRIFDGLSARASEIGAIVEVHPLVKQRHSKDARLRVRKALAADTFDGLIVSSYDELVLEVMSEQKHRPVVYLDFANRDWNLRTDLVPMVSFDLRHAMIDALKRLFALGHRKIAVIGFSHGDTRVIEQQEDQILYEYVMGRLGIEDRHTVFLSVDDASNQRLLEGFWRGSDAPTAAYFCDDVALIRAFPILAKLGCVPGQNLAVITHSNKELPLPAGPKWSRMEFDPLQVATLTLDAIVAEMKSSLPDIISLAHKPTWIEGDSHYFSGFSRNLSSPSRKKT